MEGGGDAGGDAVGWESEVSWGGWGVMMGRGKGEGGTYMLVRVWRRFDVVG